MSGVVSLLDPLHTRQVEDLWAELARDVGWRGVYGAPYPHFSYHVADAYDAPRLEPLLAAFARAAEPFDVNTSGLAIFTGPVPVLYLPVVRTAALTELHARLWPALEPLAAGSVSYYAPSAWLPHITLGFGDVTALSLAEAVRRLGESPFDWKIRIDNVALMEAVEGVQRVRWRFTLGA